jgi:MFS family permease
MRARRSETLAGTAGPTDPTRIDGSARMPAGFIGSLAFGTVLQPLNSSMIAVALVGIRTDFHAGAEVNWLVSALYLATAVAAPSMGRLADLLGARRMFLVGLGLVAAGSVLAPFAPNIGTLVACRVLLGLGTGAQYPCAMAIVRKVSQRLQARPQTALGALQICGQATVALGPTVGGLLVGLFGWQGIFWVNLPAVALGAVAVLRTVPADPPMREIDTGGRSRISQLDIPGIVLFTGSLTSLMLWLLSWASSPEWYWLAPAVLCAVALVWRERRATDPFLNVRLLSNRSLTLTYLRTVFTYTAFYLIFYGLPMWLEEARGYSPTSSGLIVLPIAVLGVISTMLATRLERHRGPRPTLLIGTGVLTAGGLLLMLPGESTPVVALLGLCAVLGLPNGFNSMGNQTAMYAASPAEHTGAAAGLFRTSQYVGANLASALLALVLGENATASSLHHMGLAVAIISACLLVGVVFNRHLRSPQPA